VIGQEGLCEVRDGLGPGQVRPADEPAQAPVAGRVAGQEDQVWSTLAFADPAQILLDERPMAGQPGSPGLQQAGSLTMPQAWKRSSRWSDRSTRNQSTSTPTRCWKV